MTKKRVLLIVTVLVLIIASLFLVSLLEDKQVDTSCWVSTQLLSSDVSLLLPPGFDVREYSNRGVKIIFDTGHVYLEYLSVQRFENDIINKLEGVLKVHGDDAGDITYGQRGGAKFGYFEYHSAGNYDGYYFAMIDGTGNMINVDIFEYSRPNETQLGMDYLFAFLMGTEF